MRATLSKVYEDAKEALIDVRTLRNSFDHFSHKVPLRRANQIDFVQHQTHIRSPELVLQPSMDCYPEFVICYLVRPMKTKGCSKITTRIRSSTETNNENSQKRSWGCYGEQGHISIGFTKHKLDMQFRQDDED